ncbi:MAG: hypothetical protein FWF02_06085 [Micrococcales bacterium]|nr:hypothetical protein [Micrococcales bacterium]MCL2667260.1 hypothetical protein [Micrococcales bacterium]
MSPDVPPCYAENLRPRMQQPLPPSLERVVPNLRVRHRTAERALVCTVDGREIARVSQHASPHEGAAFVAQLRDYLRTRVAQFAAWSSAERTVWLLRQVGITVLLTNRHRSWISAPTVWVVSRHAPLDQVNRLLLDNPHPWRWERLDLMLFLVLGLPYATLVPPRRTPPEPVAATENTYRELCRLIGFADRTTLLRRFARRALPANPTRPWSEPGDTANSTWDYDVSLYLGDCHAALARIGPHQIRAHVVVEWLTLTRKGWRPTETWTWHEDL